MKKRLHVVALVTLLLGVMILHGWQHPADGEGLRSIGTGCSRAAQRVHPAQAAVARKAFPRGGALAEPLREWSINWRRAPVAEREGLLRHWVSAMGEPALEKAMRSLAGRSEGDFEGQVRQAVLLRLATLNARKAAGYAANGAQGPRWPELILAIVREWAAREPLDAAGWIQSLGNASLVERAADILAPALAQHSRVAAGDFIAALPGGQVQSDMLDRFVSEWSARDFDAALTWARGLRPGDQQQRALVQLSYRWERRDPDGAIAFAQNLPEGNDQLLVRLVEGWTTREPQRAVAWVAALPGGPRKTRLTSIVLAGLAGEAPELAADYISALPPVERETPATVAIASRWAAQDPASVASWLEDIPSGRTRLYAIEVLAGQWVLSDPAGAGAWILRLPTGPDQDAAVGAMASAVAATQPETAAKLANGIYNEKLRRFQVDRAVKKWMQIDPAAAAAWVTASNNVNR